MLKKSRLLTRPNPGDYSPSRPEPAKTASSPRDAPSPKQEPSSLSFSLGGGQGCPLLRASNEHSFTVRVLRARRAPGYPFSFFSIMETLGLQSCQHFIHMAAHLDLAKNRLQLAGLVDHKGAALDTPILSTVHIFLFVTAVGF